MTHEENKEREIEAFEKEFLLKVNLKGVKESEARKEMEEIMQDFIVKMYAEWLSASYDRIVEKAFEDTIPKNIEWKWQVMNDGVGGTFRTCDKCESLENNQEGIHECWFYNSIIAEISNRQQKYLKK